MITKEFFENMSHKAIWNYIQSLEKEIQSLKLELNESKTVREKRLLENENDKLRDDAYKSKMQAHRLVTGLLGKQKC